MVLYTHLEVKYTYRMEVSTPCLATLHCLNYNVQKTTADIKAAHEEEGGGDEEEEYAFGKDSVLAAIEAVREGKCVVVTDDEGRENEGDIVFAAEKVPHYVDWLVCYVVPGRGFILNSWCIVN